MRTSTSKPYAAQVKGPVNSYQWKTFAVSSGYGNLYAMISALNKQTDSHIEYQIVDRRTWLATRVTEGSDGA